MLWVHFDNSHEPSPYNIRYIQQSHLIYGHMSERNSAAVTLSVIEVVLLGLDPTEGLLSILIVSILASLKSLLDANFSRETEKEAVSSFFKSLLLSVLSARHHNLLTPLIIYFYFLNKG